MNAIRWCVLLLAVIGVMPEISGKKNREKESQNLPQQSSALQDPSYNFEDIFEAVNPKYYGIPDSCSEEVLKNTLQRCVTIWRNYCKYTHCAKGTVEIVWPPSETESWKHQRPDSEWRKIDTAWKWSGKCAYNATRMWRLWCGGGLVSNTDTGEKEMYKYWFLVNMDVNAGEQYVKEQCHQQQCPGKEPEPHVTTPDREDEPEESAEGIAPDTRHDILDAVGSKPVDPWDCNNQVLTRLLSRCILIWTDYCRCVGCHLPQNCSASEWPPKEANAWKTDDRIIGWENVEDAWKWAGKCAYNATYLWRTVCYERLTPVEDIIAEQEEHNYWFLTEMQMNYHPKVVQGLCRETECHKFKEVVKPTQAVEQTDKVTAKMPPDDIVLKTTHGPTTTTAKPLHVPKWAYIIIAVLAAIVILLVVIFAAFCYYRRQAKLQQTNQQGIRRNQHETSSGSNQWQMGSFGYYENKSLPGIPEDIYHTIGEENLPPAPESPTFPMSSFSPIETSQTNSEDDGRSVPNVLYHDTTPRFTNTSVSRFPAFAPDPPSDQQHTYEDTEPRLLPLTPSAPPITPPYFVPTGEYGTLNDGDEVDSSNEREESMRRNSKGNYDHIKLL